MHSCTTNNEFISPGITLVDSRSFSEEESNIPKGLLPKHSIAGDIIYCLFLIIFFLWQWQFAIIIAFFHIKPLNIIGTVVPSVEEPESGSQMMGAGNISDGATVAVLKSAASLDVWNAVISGTSMALDIRLEDAAQQSLICSSLTGDILNESQVPSRNSSLMLIFNGRQTHSSRRSFSGLC